MAHEHIDADQGMIIIIGDPARKLLSENQILGRFLNSKAHHPLPAEDENYPGPDGIKRAH